MAQWSISIAYRTSYFADEGFSTLPRLLQSCALSIIYFLFVEERAKLAVLIIWVVEKQAKPEVATKAFVEKWDRICSLGFFFICFCLVEKRDKIACTLSCLDQVC